VVGYFESTVSLTEAYGYAAGLTMMSLAVALLHHKYFYEMDRIGFHIRAGMCALMYKKVKYQF